MKTGTDYSGNVDKFVDGLNKYVREEGNLIKILSVCTVNNQSRV